MMRFFLWAILGLVIIVPTPASARMVERFQLENGLHAVLINDTTIPAVAHGMLYHVGSMDDPQGQSGLSHFLEHLMFKETEYLKEGEYSALLSYQGADDNAFTSKDLTFYYQMVTKDRLPLIMALEATRMRGLVLSEDVVAREREVVVEERLMRVGNNPFGLLQEQMNAALFVNHPYGRPVIGWQHEIEGYDQAQVQAHYDHFYRPDNATLIVVGDLTKDELYALAQQHYGWIAKPDAPLTRTAWHEPATLARIDLSMASERVNQREWQRRYRTQNMHEIPPLQAAAVAVLAQILGDDESGLLMQELVVKRGIASEASAWADLLTRGPAQLLMAVTPKENASIEAINRAVDGLILSLDDAEKLAPLLAPAKQALRAELLYSQDGLRAQAFALARIIGAGQDASLLEQWPEMLAKVTLEDVQQAVQNVLHTESYVTGVIHP